MKAKHIIMIGHGTNGSDNIEEGIHLRWGFNDKLGFPHCFSYTVVKVMCGINMSLTWEDSGTNTSTLHLF